MSIEVITIDKRSPYLEDVIELGTENSDTLGFLPKKAFIEFAGKKQILVATDQKKNFLGYLLYGINRKEILVYITHLCVKESERGKGSAKALFNRLKELTQGAYRGIRIHCRRDYEIASKVWPQLGFIAVSEKSGRSKHGSTLTKWWFDYNQPNLLTFISKQQTQKLRVVIDANVFYDFQCPIDSVNKQSHFLQVDWLQENVELCLTSEIFNEINRQEDQTKRDEARKFAHQHFTILSVPDDEFKKIRNQLRPFFSKEIKEIDEQDISDLNQLARSIAATVQFFITRDHRLRKRVVDHIYETFGVRIMQPADFIVNQDEFVREAEYQPVRLAGSRIRSQRIHGGQRDCLEEIFYIGEQEKKSEFGRKLSQYLADPRTFQANSIQEANTQLALIVYGRQKEQELDIPLLRIVKSSLSATLARYLVFSAVVISALEKRKVTKVTDCCLSDEIIDALQENGFFLVDGIWIKVNLPCILSAKDLSATLLSFNSQFSGIEQYVHELLTVLNTTSIEKNTQTLLRLEKALWPVKITDLDIPAFVIPIKPIWAMHLFDENISTQDLFGGNPNLILQLENVYYRASSPKVLSAPARILWYVSEGEYQGVKSIRACSYLDEVLIDKPKALFSRFKRLGVFEWKDVSDVAKNDVNREIMAFRFSNTEILSHPIFIDEVRRIWKEQAGKSFQPQTPVSIPKQRFFDLYAKGLQVQ